MARDRRFEAGARGQTACAADSAHAEGVVAQAGERLRRATAAAARKARALGRPVLASLTASLPPLDPLDVFGRSIPAARSLMLWARPADRFSLVGVDSAWAFTTDGPDRFTRASAAWQRVRDQGVACGAEAGPWGAGPVALGAFSFSPQPTGGALWDGYPAGVLVVPRLSVTTTREGTWFTLAVMADASQTSSTLDDEVGTSLDLVANALGSGPPAEAGRRGSGDLVMIEEFPPAEAWKATVAAAARAVREGPFRKIVLSRGLRVRAGRLDPIEILRTLRADYPACTVFAVTRGGQCFLGATPERLVRVRGGEVHVAAIAGSAPRGLTEEEDGRLGAALLASVKDQVEHAVVVDALRDALAPVCTSISVGAAPVLFKIRNVQHLHTPLSARLRGSPTVLELADLLHPTPAVGGVPREEAVRWIARHEGWDRGWYAGTIGWMDRAGEGECAVAIRSALLRGSEAFLFAGCGIMAVSDPDEEYAESSLKLRAVLSALTGS